MKDVEAFIINERCLRRRVMAISNENGVEPPKISQDFLRKMTKFVNEVVKTSILDKPEKKRIMTDIYLPKNVIKPPKVIETGIIRNF